MLGVPTPPPSPAIPRLTRLLSVLRLPCAAGAAPDAADAARNGKVFLQPARGWMAGFRGGQVLVIRFALQPRAAIHPDQGQVELYHDVEPGRPDRGVLEMEAHASYRRLAPGAAMDAHELWTLLPYAGPDTHAAHLAFLRQHARALHIVLP